jgi:hypothetical protein
MPGNRTLQGILDDARRSGSLDECLTGLAATLNAEFPIDRIVVGLRPPGGNRLELVGVWTAGATQLRRGATLRLDATSFRRIEESGESLTVSGYVSAQSLPLIEQVLRTERVSSAVSVPLWEDDSVVGLVTFGSRALDAFSRHRLLFETIGIMFQNAFVELGRRALAPPDPGSDVAGQPEFQSRA